MIATLRHYWRLAQEERQRRQPVVSAGTQPLILGPWLGEVGPELQYWIPFIAKLKASGILTGRRLIVISRGGVASWYRHITSDYSEVFDLVNQADYKALRTERTTEKQFDWTAGERQLVSKVAKHLDINQYDTIHPGAMWQRLLPYFKEQQGLPFILEQLFFQLFDQLTLTPPVGLPEHYVAIRFYQSELFPATVENQSSVADLLARLTKRHNVVALVTQQQLDDHAQFPLPQNERLHRVVIDQSLAANLGLQTAVLAKADVFIGTYGGLTILPGLLGKPCVGFIGTDLGKQRALHFRHEAVTAVLYAEFVRQPYLVQSLSTWRLALEYVYC